MIGEDAFRFRGAWAGEVGSARHVSLSVAVRQSRSACVEQEYRDESEVQSVSDGRNEMASDRSGRIRELRVAVKEVTEGK